MNIKSVPLTKEQLQSFSKVGSMMGSLATLPLPGTYITELKKCGINERGTPRNYLLGCVVTQPTGSQLVIEAAYFDSKDGQDNGDLHVVNFKSQTLSSYYGGWGTWKDYYGDGHWGNKDFLRSQIGTLVHSS